MIGIGLSPIGIFSNSPPVSKVEEVLAAPVNVAAPAIMGLAKQGETLNSSTGTWLANGSEITAFRFQWLRDSEEIVGATDDSYLLVEDDAGALITVEVVAENEVGIGVAVSDPTGRVQLADHAPINTAIPTIAGITRSEETLIASSNGEWTGNGDEILDFTYQWLKNDEVMAGKTGTTLHLTDAEIGSKISLRVTAENSIGQTSAVSLKTSSIVAAQHFPGIVSAPVISGTARVPQTLTVSNGTWNNGNSVITSYAYQWFRDDVEISAETGNSYTLTVADEGAEITASVTATNGVGSTTATSNPTSPVLPESAPPISLVRPAVTGEFRQGKTVSASTGSWDENGAEISGYTYQWFNAADGSIVGATAPEYALQATDVDDRVYVEVTATNSAGSTTASSVQSSAIASPAKPVSVTKPEITGDKYRVGVELTATTGTWDDGGSTISSYTYQWRSNDADIAGATSSTYTPTEADVGKALKVAVKATNAGGEVTAVSLATPSIASATAIGAPINVAKPAISGTAAVGETLTATNGLWDENGAAITEYTYQWYTTQRGVIAGAIASTYEIQTSDAGRNIRCRVTATNSAGSTYEYSATTTTVSDIEMPTNITPPSIAADEWRAGFTASADQGEWDEHGTAVAYTYQWRAANVDIPGATDSEYLITADAVDKKIRVIVRATNAAGVRSAISAESPVIVRAYMPPVNTALPTISGSAIEGEVLTGTDGTWTADHTITGYTYQWNRDGSPISGATAMTYTLVSDDAGHRVSFTVSATSVDGTSAATSVETDEVLAANSLPVALTKPTIDPNVPTTSDTLVVTAGTYTTASEITFSYQWYKDGAVIDGATGTSLALSGSDAGAVFSVMETATNVGGSVNQMSDDTAAVAAPYDADAIAYFDAMSVAPDSTLKSKINDLVSGLKTAGVWDKLDILGIHAVHDEQAGRINAKTPSHVATKVGTVSFAANHGFTGDGSTGCLDWNKAPSSLTQFTQNSATMAIWLLTSTTSTVTDIGWPGGTNWLRTFISGTSMTIRPNSSTQVTIAVASAVGLSGYSRTGASAGFAARDKAKTTFSSASSALPTSTNLRTLNGLTMSNNYSDRQAAFTVIGAGLSETEWDALYDALDAYLTAVGAH